MNRKIGGIAVVLMFAAAAGATVRSKFIVVESPLDLPELAQVRSEAMHLYYEGPNRAILYLEQDGGRKLAILDVSDPGKIQTIGQVSINAPGAYDFVQDLSSSSVLVHYRDHSGFGVIDFKNYKRPVLTGEPDYMHPSSVQAYGGHGLLLISSSQPSVPPPQMEQYEVLDISNSPDPAPLATIHGVRQRLDREETGTIFLLNDDGLNVVRCLTRERAHEDSIVNHKN